MFLLWASQNVGGKQSYSKKVFGYIFDKQFRDDFDD